MIVSVRRQPARGGAMEISDVRIKRVESPGKLKAYVSVTFDNCFVVHNLKVIAGQTGVFIAMPSRRTKTGEYKDIAHPISPAFRQKVQERILVEYDAGHGTTAAAEAQDDDEPSEA
jgi:stage V sporulation protein G